MTFSSPEFPGLLSLRYHMKKDPSLSPAGAATLVGFDVKSQTFTLQSGQPGSMTPWDCG